MSSNKNEAKNDISNETDLNRLQLERFNKLSKIQEQNINPYPYKFERSHTALELQDKYKDLPSETETEDEVYVCGRIMNERNTWMFVDLLDDTAKIQLFCHKQNLEATKLANLKLLDKGDFIGAFGKIRRTKSGELSVKVLDYTILAKSLSPIPDSWDGFKDIEDRYRYRHLDLITHPEVKNTFRTRSKIVSFIRHFLDNNGYLEIETPVLIILKKDWWS